MLARDVSPCVDIAATTLARACRACPTRARAPRCVLAWSTRAMSELATSVTSVANAATSGWRKVAACCTLASSSSVAFCWAANFCFFLFPRRPLPHVEPPGKMTVNEKSVHTTLPPARSKPNWTTSPCSNIILVLPLVSRVLHVVPRVINMPCLPTTNSSNPERCCFSPAVCELTREKFLAFARAWSRITMSTGLVIPVPMLSVGRATHSLESGETIETLKVWPGADAHSNVKYGGSSASSPLSPSSPSSATSGVCEAK